METKIEQSITAKTRVIVNFDQAQQLCVQGMEIGGEGGLTVRTSFMAIGAFAAAAMVA